MYPGLEYRVLEEPILEILSGVDNEKQETKLNTNSSTKELPQTSMHTTDAPIVKIDETEVETILIHVCDEPRQINRDFVCKKDILLKEMKYFSKYLDGTGAYDDIDISVHCDVTIFEWLVQYIHKTNTLPKLNTNIVVSILISSDFLGMDNLVTKCIEFVGNNLQAIVNLPLDLNCLSSDLCRRLATILPSNILGVIEDQRGKIIPKLYQKKIEAFATQQNVLFDLLHKSCLLKKCKFCEKIYLSSEISQLICKKTKISIGFRGNVISQHSPIEGWTVAMEIDIMQKAGLSYSEQYWKLWGFSRSVYCARCKCRIPIAEIGNCTYHPKKPIFKSKHLGIYPCCNSPCQRFVIENKEQGCTARNHKIILKTEKEKQNYNVAVSLSSLILKPFVFTKDTKTNFPGEGKSITINTPSIVSKAQKKLKKSGKVSKLQNKAKNTEISNTKQNTKNSGNDDSNVSVEDGTAKTFDNDVMWPDFFKQQNCVNINQNASKNMKQSNQTHPNVCKVVATQNNKGNEESKELSSSRNDGNSMVKLGIAGKRVPFVVPVLPTNCVGHPSKIRGWKMDIQRNIDEIRMSHIIKQVKSMQL
eukprot:GSMAST32.ASY1.ANO1.2673.1 assembled CDS